MKRTAKQGIALVSVLLMSLIFLAMAGAFFTAHKADLALMGASNKIQETKSAALSAAEFLHYKLENDRFFSTVAFNNEQDSFPPSASTPLLVARYRGDGTNPLNNVVEGRLESSNLDFEAHVLNNLNSNTVGHHPLGNTPPRSARVWITAERGHVKKRMDFILKRSPFSSVSMLSGANVSVQLAPSEDGHWWLGARQPSGNGVRANGTVTGPEVLSETGRAVLFEHPRGLGSRVNPPYGTIQGRDLRMQMNGVATDIMPGDANLEQVQDNIRGVLSPGSAEVKVPELDSDKLTSPAKVFQAPSQEISFRTVENAYGQVTHRLVEDGSVTATYNPSMPHTRYHHWRNEFNETVATFDLESRVMTVSQGVEIQNDSGNFVLKDGNATEGNQPTLVLGSKFAPASIAAEGIDIRGSVGGLGSLKAGDGDLKIRAKSSLSTTPDYGIALHSERDVVLSKPGKSAQDGIPADWDAFSSGLNNANAPGENLSLDGWSTADEATKNQKTAEFTDVILSEPGEVTAGTDPLWLGLSQEFPDASTVVDPQSGQPVDQVAYEMYEEWMQPHVPAEMGPDPDYDPIAAEAERPLIPQLDPDTGEPVLDPDTLEPVEIPDPDWVPEGPEIVEIAPEVDAGPGLTVENYVRLREYLKTAEGGAPDSTWLNSSEPSVNQKRRGDVLKLVENQISSFQLSAGQSSEEIDGQVVLSWNSLDEYLTQPRNPFLTGYNPDMRYRGLIYSGGDFRFDTEKLGIEVEGAVVAQGDISISNATGARIIYNSELLEGLFTTHEGDASAELDKAFWAYY